MTDKASLGIVIPVWNLPDDLAHLLDQVSRMGIFSEIVVSDDGSDIPCDPATLGFTEERLGGRLVYLRSLDQRGAGHARNLALASVTAHNLLFFDADDHLAPELPAIWQQHLNADCPDFTTFRHSDTRILEGEGREGTFPTEESRWKLALGTRSSAILTLAEAVGLCSISNYPWNKIYRTDFLRGAKITCSETPVHNDIRLHWLSFLRARRIQADTRIGAVHVIQDRDHHLTIRQGAERLCLGPILEDLVEELQATPDRRIFMRQFIQFSDDLCRWNLDHVDLAVVPDFKRLMISLYMRLRPEDFRIFAEWRPDQAEEIVAFLLREGG
jgi:glycosyltransferase involved in cell wall biosynthesis